MRRSLLTIFVVSAVLLGGSVSAGAAPLGWFGPILPNSTGGSGETARALACPSISQCTAVENQGQQVTFNPSAPGNPAPTTLDAGNSLQGIACPSISQCTAVDNEGRQVTFNPATPAGPAPTKTSGTSFFGLACPSLSECIGVGNPTSSVVTFNPDAPQSPAVSDLDGGGLVAVACPSSTQCTAVDESGREITFNPTAPGDPAPSVVDAGAWLEGVACPSVSQCTAVDNEGRQVTFNPTTPGSPAPIAIAAGDSLQGVACPSSTLCAAVSGSGAVVFNPTEGHGQTPFPIEADTLASAIACPSVSQCTAVAGSEEVTFNPSEPTDHSEAPNPPAGADMRPAGCPALGPCPVAQAVTKLVFEDQRVTLTAPAAHTCISPGEPLRVTLSSVAISSSAAKLTFSSAAFYLDRGVAHRERRRSHTTYSPNAAVPRLPATFVRPLTGLGRGAHTLKVELRYVETRLRNGRRVRLSVTRTLLITFHVCASQAPAHTSAAALARKPRAARQRDYRGAYTSSPTSRAALDIRSS